MCVYACMYVFLSGYEFSSMRTSTVFDNVTLFDFNLLNCFSSGQSARKGDRDSRAFITFARNVDDASIFSSFVPEIELREPIYSSIYFVLTLTFAGRVSPPVIYT